MDRSWSAYLLHTAFAFSLTIPILVAAVYLMPPPVYERYHMLILALAILVGIIGGNMLHARFIVLARRDEPRVAGRPR